VLYNIATCTEERLCLVQDLNRDKTLILQNGVVLVDTQNAIHFVNIATKKRSSIAACDCRNYFELHNGNIIGMHSFGTYLIDTQTKSTLVSKIHTSRITQLADDRIVIVSYGMTYSRMIVLDTKLNQLFVHDLKGFGYIRWLSPGKGPLLVVTLEEQIVITNVDNFEKLLEIECKCKKAIQLVDGKIVAFPQMDVYEKQNFVLQLPRANENVDVVELNDNVIAYEAQEGGIITCNTNTFVQYRYQSKEWTLVGFVKEPS
jgi:hypothetical protein